MSGGGVQNCRRHRGTRRKTGLKTELTLEKAGERKGKNLAPLGHFEQLTAPSRSLTRCWVVSCVHDTFPHCLRPPRLSSFFEARNSPTGSDWSTVPMLPGGGTNKVQWMCFAGPVNLLGVTHTCSSEILLTLCDLSGFEPYPISQRGHAIEF